MRMRDEIPNLNNFVVDRYGEAFEVTQEKRRKWWKRGQGKREEGRMGRREPEERKRRDDGGEIKAKKR